MEPKWTQKITLERIPDEKLQQPPRGEDKIVFGAQPCPYMLTSEYSPESGWGDARIQPFAPMMLYPDSVVLHYGQQIFEGLKAYRSQDDIHLFRPERNARRFYNSAVRLGMVPVPEAMFLECVKALVKQCADWVLPSPASLYIRPFMIPSDRGVSLRAGQNYLFFIILSPAKNYYSSDTGVSVYVERKLVRAAPGGVGEAKCGGNYAASLLPMRQAKQAGCEQVLWLDAAEHKYIEEVGAMNFMVAYGDLIKTPRLSGSILPGVTRDSLIQLAPTLGLQIEETELDIDQVLQDIDEGKITEAFGCGTAAIVSPVEALVDGKCKHQVKAEGIGPVAAKLKNALEKIQSGAAEDPFSWRVTI